MLASTPLNASYISFLHDDGLSLVLDQLDIDSIQTLLLSGDVNLAMRIRRLVRSATKEYGTGRVAIFPTSLPLLPGITKIDLRCIHHIQDIHGIDLRSIPPTIQYIRFDFFNGLLWFLDPQQDRSENNMTYKLGDIRSRFPHLISLYATMFSNAEIWVDPLRLPPHITNLDFGYCAIHIKEDDLAKLPSTLTFLEHLWIDPKSAEPLALPASLTSLRFYDTVKLPSFSALSALPSGLTHFSMRIPASDLPSDFSDLSFLPSTLLTLHMTLPYVSNLMATLPRSLTELRIDGSRTITLTPTDVAQLPPRITLLDTPFNVDPEAIKYLPPSLRTIMGRFREIMFDPEHIPFLPPSLTIAYLDWPKVTPLAWKKLPRGLYSMAFQKTVPEDADFAALPPAISAIRVPGEAWFLSKLPFANLQDLSIYKWASENLEQVARMRNLVNLDLGDHVDLAQVLIHLGDKLENGQPYETRMPNLKALSLSKCIANSELEHLLLGFPSGLDYLSLSGKECDLPLFVFHMVSRLTHLERIFVEDIAPGLSRSEILALPRKLCKLHVTGGYSNISKADIALLPSSLSELDFPHSTCPSWLEETPADNQRLSFGSVKMYHLSNAFPAMMRFYVGKLNCTVREHPFRAGDGKFTFVDPTDPIQPQEHSVVSEN